MTRRLAVFDCDGTLVDSQATICRAMGDAFAACGLPPPPDRATRAIIGLSLPEAMALLAPTRPPADHQALAAAYKAAFHALRAQGEVVEPLYPGIADTLATLAAQDWLLGVATGKSDRGLALVLAHHGLADRFVTLQTADRHPSKPHPAMLEAAIAAAGARPETTAMIGDTSFDMGMARAAGAAAIGVAWGYHDEPTLWAAGSAKVAAHAADLPMLLARAA